MKVKEQNAKLSLLSLLHLIFVGLTGAAITEFYKKDRNILFVIPAATFAVITIGLMVVLYSKFFTHKKNRKR